MGEDEKPPESPICYPFSAITWIAGVAKDVDYEPMIVPLKSPEPPASKRDESILYVVGRAISRSIADRTATVNELSEDALRLIKQILAEHEGHEESRPGDELLPCRECRRLVIIKLGQLFSNSSISVPPSWTCDECGKSIVQMVSAARDNWLAYTDSAVGGGGNG